MKKKTVRKYMYVVYLISIILYCNAPEVSATTEVSMTTEPSNENLIDVSKSLVYPSNLDITNFKGDHVNSGIVKVTSEKTVTLNYGISYYGEGDITLLEVIPSDVENASIQVFNNKDATGLILITVSENFFDTNIVFSVVGGATTYSQTIRLEKVPENENDNIPPITNTPEEPVNPYLNTPKEPVNPETNMPEKPLNPKFNTPEVPANPDVNSPKAPIDPNIDPAGTDDQNGKEIDMNQKSNKTNSLGRRLLTTSIGNSDFPKKKKLLKYPKTGESQDLWNGSLSVLGVILIILVWKMKEYFSN